MSKCLVYALSLLIALPFAAAAQQVVPGRNQILRLDGSASRPSDTYERDQDLGRYRIGADNEGNTAAGALRWDWNTARINLSVGYGITFNGTAGFFGGGANIIEQRNGATGQEFRVYATTDGTNTEYGSLRFIANEFRLGTVATGTGVARPMVLATNGIGRFYIGPTGGFIAYSDNTDDVGGATNGRPRNVFVAGPALTPGAGTGITVNSGGQLQRLVYKVTIDRTAFVCAAVTCDLTLATAPARTAILSIYADLTQVFACTATCTSSTLSMTAGTTTGGAQLLASFDADAAIAVFGDVDAEMGTIMTRAVAVQGGAVTWPGTGLTVRLTSGTGNIGTGVATNLSQGSITFYIVTERLP